MNNYQLERMELEVRDLEPQQRERSGGRIKSYQVELKRLEGEFIRSRSSSNEGMFSPFELMDHHLNGLFVYSFL